MNAAQVLALGAPTCCKRSGGGASDGRAVTVIVRAAGRLRMEVGARRENEIVPEPVIVNVVASGEEIVPPAGEVAVGELV